MGWFGTAKVALDCSVLLGEWDSEVLCLLWPVMDVAEKWGCPQIQTHKTLPFLSTGKSQGITFETKYCEPAHIPKGYTQLPQARLAAAFDEDAWQKLTIGGIESMKTARISDKFMIEDMKTPIDLTPKNGINFDNSKIKRRTAETPMLQIIVHFELEIVVLLQYQRKLEQMVGQEKRLWLLKIILKSLGGNRQQMKILIGPRHLMLEQVTMPNDGT
ncbi:hypothetical protein Tco_0451518 [Tanacetum coccineum]